MSQISFYNSLPAKGQSHTASGQMSIMDFVNGIKFGKWKDIILPVREEKEKEKRNALKRSLVSVTVSGIFNERKEDKLISHSGFICIDVDNFTDKSSIIKDRYTYACFDSVSGNGFAVIVKVNPQKHKESFRFLQKYYFECFGIIVDPAPQNVASLRYVSYDPLVEVNEKSKLSGTYTEPKKKVQSLPIVLTGDKISEYVNESVSRHVDIAANYSDYLNLSFALVDGFGEGGRRYFHSLCSVNEKYDSRHADKQYDIAIKRGKSGISVGTFYHMLKNAGINIKSDTKVVSIAALGKKAGRSKEAVIAQLEEINGIPKETAVSLVDQVFQRDDINLKSVNTDPEHLIESIVEWIYQNHNLRRNEITKAIEENSVDVRKERLNTIYLRARSVFNTTDVNYDLIERVIFSEFTPNFNPIQEYIDKNSYRNGNGNIDLLCHTINSDSPMGYIFLRKWLISIIAAFKGNPVRSVLALVGGQNTGKTEFFRRLLPDELKRYYAESKLDAGKDDDLLMCQKLIVMDDEMGGKSKEDEKRFKELTSKQYFSLRAPYARQNEDFKRLAILCGTSNDTAIINDRTGNTRILTIEIKSINHAAYNEINKDELFMELYRAYENGEEWQLNNEELGMLTDVSKKYESINFERELILKFFRAKNHENEPSEQLTATDIKNHIETYSKQQIRNMKAMGIELKKIFGEHIQKKGVGRVYNVVKKEEFNNNSLINNNMPNEPVKNYLEPVGKDIDDALPF